ncbi:MAG: hypothetical protein AB3N14_09600 [Flavobacteriaceae bacterium]
MNTLRVICWISLLSSMVVLPLFFIGQRKETINVSKTMALESFELTGTEFKEYYFKRLTYAYELEGRLGKRENKLFQEEINFLKTWNKKNPEMQIPIDDSHRRHFGGAFDVLVMNPELQDLVYVEKMIARFETELGLTSRWR